MSFIRFVVARRHPDSEVEDGAFTLAYELRRSVQVDAVDLLHVVMIERQRVSNGEIKTTRDIVRMGDSRPSAIPSPRPTLPVAGRVYVCPLLVE